MVFKEVQFHVLAIGIFDVQEPKRPEKIPPSGSGPLHRARGGEVIQEPDPAPPVRAAAGREPGRRGGGGQREAAAD